MALLKHPLTRLGWPALEIRRAARILEVGAFRAPYIGSGIDGILAALDRQDEAVEKGERRDRAGRRLRVEDWASARDLIEAIRDAYQPLLELRAGAVDHALQDLAEAHLKVGEALARTPIVTADDADRQNMKSTPPPRRPKSAVTSCGATRRVPRLRNFSRI